MAKTTKKKGVIEQAVEETLNEVINETKPKVNTITQEFGNGDLNILRDKINEIIKSL